MCTNKNNYSSRFKSATLYMLHQALVLIMYPVFVNHVLHWCMFQVKKEGGRSLLGLPRATMGPQTKVCTAPHDLDANQMS